MYEISIDVLLRIRSYGLEIDFKIMLPLEINLTKYVA